MQAVVRTGLVALASVALAACGSVAVPTTNRPGPHPESPKPMSIKSVSAISAPPAGTRAEADALARKLLSKVRLPGAHRLPPMPVPQSLRQPSLSGGATASVDLHRLFELPQPMQAVAAALAAKVPVRMTLGFTSASSGPADQTSAEVGYTARSVPAGVDEAQLVLTVVPGTSGGSLARADAQVILYPPRSAAEYIDPARYHVLTVSVAVGGATREHTIRKVVTSPAVITRLAGVLDRSQANPTTTISCPIIFAGYRLAFAVSTHSVPVVVVTATRRPCEGARVSADGRMQPSLQDAARVVAAVDRLLDINPRP